MTGAAAARCRSTCGACNARLGAHLFHWLAQSSSPGSGGVAAGSFTAPEA